MSKGLLFTSFLQRIGQKLVQLGHLRGNGKVDSPVTNFDNKPSNNIGVDLSRLENNRRYGCLLNMYLVNDLQLLALSDILGLGDGGLKTTEELGVEVLEVQR
jgi:hypothetical protein